MVEGEAASAKLPNLPPLWGDGSFGLGAIGLPWRGRRARHALATPAVAGDSAARDRSAVQPAFDGIVEHPGYGIEGTADGITWRLGRAGWAQGGQASVAAHGLLTVLTRNGSEVATFLFEDMPRKDAARAIAQLQRYGMHIEVLSGDSEAAAATWPRPSGSNLFRRPPARRKGRAHRGDGAGRPQGADGRRRAERRAGAGRRACIDGARVRRRCRAQRRRLRLPAREPCGRAARSASRNGPAG